MLINEAIWIRDFLSTLDMTPNQSVLDIGSSTESFRCLVQPHIDYYVYRPLSNRGVNITHMDAKAGAGVDLVCDLTSPMAEETVRQTPPADVVLCTSLLEHVTDRNTILNRLKSLVKPGGILILSVPCRMRYHPDPIDTMYRASKTDLEIIFQSANYERMASAIVECPSVPFSVTFAKGPIKLPISEWVDTMFGRELQRILAAIGRRMNALITVPSSTAIVAVRKPRKETGIR